MVASRKLHSTMINEKQSPESSLFCETLMEWIEREIRSKPDVEAQTIQVDGLLN